MKLKTYIICTSFTCFLQIISIGLFAQEKKQLEEQALDCASLTQIESRIESLSNSLLNSGIGAVEKTEELITLVTNSLPESRMKDSLLIECNILKCTSLKNEKQFANSNQLLVKLLSKTSYVDQLKRLHELSASNYFALHDQEKTKVHLERFEELGGSLSDHFIWVRLHWANYFQKFELYPESKKELESIDSLYLLDPELFDSSHLRKLFAIKNNLALDLREYKDAVRYGLKELSFAQDSIFLPYTYDRLAWSYDEFGLLDSAVFYYKKALDLNQLVYGGNSKRKTLHLNNIAISYRKLGLLEKAISALREIEVLYQNSNYDDREITLSLCYGNLGNMFNQSGKLEKSIEYFMQALELFKKIYGENSTYSAITYNNLANIYFQKGEFQRSLELSNRALSISSKLSNPNSFNWLRSRKATVLIALERYEEAEEIVRAQLLNESSNTNANTNPLTAQIRLNLAELYHKNSKFCAAKNQFHLAKDIYLSGNAQWRLPEYFFSISKFYLENNDLAQAQNEIDSCLHTLLRSQVENTTLSEANQVLFLDALILKLQIFEAHENNGDAISPSEVMEIMDLFDKKYIQVRNPFAREKLKLELQRLYVSYVKTCLNLIYDINPKYDDKEKLIRKVYELIERAKGNIELDEIRKDKVIPLEKKTELDDLKIMFAQLNQFKVEKEQSIDSEKRTQLESNIFDLQNKIDKLSREFISIYEDTDWNQQVIPVSEVQNFCEDEDVEFLNYYSSDSCLFIVKIDESSIDLFRINHDSTFFNKLEEFREVLYLSKDIDPMEYNQLAFEVYESLIPSQCVINSERLIVSPHGVMQLIPFAALTKSIEGSEFYSLDYLLNEYLISYVPSITIGYEMFFKQNNSNEFLGVAPTFENGNEPIASSTRSELVPLYYNKEEIEKIEELYTGRKLFDHQASKENFINSVRDKQIIHLATHAKSYPNNNQLSFVALQSASSDSSQSKLLIPEIYNLNINADLVYLSACETGLGEIKPEEGVYSISRAFSIAGSKSIISTLWSVNDKISKDMAVSFYQFMKTGKTKDESLIMSQQAHLKNYSGSLAHPYYWAGLVLNGDFQTIESKQFWWGYYVFVLLLGLALYALLRRFKIL